MNSKRVAQDSDNWQALDKAHLGHRIVLNLSIQYNSTLKSRLNNLQKRTSKLRTLLHYRWSFNWWRHSVWNSTSFLRIFFLSVGVCEMLIRLTDEGRTWYRRFLDRGRCLNIIYPRMERKFHNSAPTPDGTLRRAKAYTTSYITRGNVLMGRAGDPVLSDRDRKQRHWERKRSNRTN